MVVRPPGAEPVRIGPRIGEVTAGHAMWHVTVTVGGTPVPAEDVRLGLEALAQLHPFLLSGRYAEDRAEVRYWDEGETVAGVLDVGLGLWSHHRDSAGLPPWDVVGIEVVDQETYRRRSRSGELDTHLAAIATITPFA